MFERYRSRNSSRVTPWFAVLALGPFNRNTLSCLTPYCLALSLFTFSLSSTPCAANPLDAGNSRAGQSDKNIVLFITDDESPTLGCYGDLVARTPAIDALAKEGTRFTNAFATTASCSASRSVILSGLHNHMNGQYGHTHDFHKFSSYPDVVQLALPRLLAQAGYRTAKCGKYHVAPEAVFHFETTIPGNTRSPVQMANNCRKFIEAPNDSRPFFLYFATSDPHRGGGVDQTSPLKLKPDLFGNKKGEKNYPGVKEVFYDPSDMQVPNFLPDTQETRSELAQYYQSVARIDQGLAQLVKILKDARVYNKTLIVFTADHGIAFSGGKTTVYEPGLRVPFIVRNPYQKNSGVVCNALLSHVDITPSLLDFAGALDAKENRPAKPIDADEFWKDRGQGMIENRRGPNRFERYHGRSWIPILGNAMAEHHPFIFASHTFHEIQMYYPMRVYRDKQYKLIWNIAYKLDYPFASDLWAASSWQAQFQQGPNATYGQKTVAQYIERPRFELFDIAADPNETTNLALDPAYADTLTRYQLKLKKIQHQLNDPWIMKWEYE